jgi:hypothetical protein
MMKLLRMALATVMLAAAGCGGDEDEGCCVWCGSGAQACGDDCIPLYGPDNTCEEPPGCACNT